MDKAKRITTGLLLTIVMAMMLWGLMFSPWTKGITNFWATMVCAGLSLVVVSSLFDHSWMKQCKEGVIWKQVLLGIAIAAVLWWVFWIGDKLSQMMFGFARPQVDLVYAMRDGYQAWAIGLLLLCIVGPAEEIFWRGFVQKNLQDKIGKNVGFLLTTGVYTLIHIWSLNFMLIMAALVAGLVWGLLYRLRPQWLLALIVSHAVWDMMVFVVIPI